MGTYLSAHATASALIKKKGSAVTLTRPKTTSYFDPITQTEIAAGVDVWTFMAVVMPASSQTRYKAATLEVQVSDEAYFALDNGTVYPQPGDVVRFGGADYKVTWSQTYDPAGDGAIFTTAFLER